MKLSIIIPAFNEEDRIVRTLENTLFYLQKQKYKAEVIVISDGSNDRTKEVVENFKSKERISLKCFEYHPNRGKGYAVRFGMLRGDGDFVMFMDADYSVPIEEVQRGITLLNDGYDIAIASRAVSESVIKHHQNFFRELSAKLYTFIQNLYLGIHYKDTQCGFKIYRKHVARELFSKQKLASVIFDPELLWLAKLSGFSVGEFPVEWSHVEGSRIQYDNIKKSLFIFQELFRIKKLHMK
jgi:dolichyl-phosphate beta-glucosyltransferase